jgi:uncharacterized coiled-coil protein SlyX
MGQTSIPCDSEVRDRLAEDKPEDASWSEYLSILHSDQEIVIESEASIPEGERIAEHLRRLEGRLKDLETTIPRKTAEELKP